MFCVFLEMPLNEEVGFVKATKKSQRHDSAGPLSKCRGVMTNHLTTIFCTFDCLPLMRRNIYTPLAASIFFSQLPVICSLLRM